MICLQLRETHWENNSKYFVFQVASDVLVRHTCNNIRRLKMWGLVFSLGRVRVRYLGLIDVLVICQVLVVMGMIISKRWMDEGAREEDEGVIRDFRED